MFFMTDNGHGLKVAVLLNPVTAIIPYFLIAIETFECEVLVLADPVRIVISSLTLDSPDLLEVLVLASP